MDMEINLLIRQDIGPIMCSPIILYTYTGRLYVCMVI